MNTAEKQHRRQQAAATFDQYQRSSEGTRLVDCLDDGLDTLRDLLFTRVHADVEQVFGLDSMLLPVSPVESELKAKREIDIYQVAEAAAVIRHRRYIEFQENWVLPWLGKLRLGDKVDDKEVAQRLSDYALKSAGQRQRAFSIVLERTFPEATRVPLVVYRLLPLAVLVATASAFGDQAAAGEARSQQMELLPVIGECLSCHAKLLDNGQKCAQCGNPLWKYDWLTAD